MLERSSTKLTTTRLALKALPALEKKFENTIKRTPSPTAKIGATHTCANNLTKQVGAISVLLLGLTKLKLRLRGE
jgi:hypothetical protein